MRRREKHSKNAAAKSVCFFLYVGPQVLAAKRAQAAPRSQLNLIGLDGDLQMLDLKIKGVQ